MPVKVNVGLTKKVGLPQYGSAGASCHLEFELDTGQILENPDSFQRHLQHAYGACRQAVQEELSRQLNPSPQSDEPVETPEPKAVESTEDAPAGSVNTPATLGLVQSSPRASQRQLNYVHHLAHGLAGMTPRRLEILAATVCGKRLAHLTTADASRLIETLKEIENGDKDLSGVPQEVSA